MKYLNAIILICCCHAAVGQGSRSDTFYFSRYMDTSSKKDAQYFKVYTYEFSTLKISDYTKDGQLVSSGFYNVSYPEVKDGYFRMYSTKGALESEGNYIEGKKSGLWAYYREDGSLHYEENYAEGKLSGKLKSYYRDKSLKREENYNNGEFVNGKCFTLSGKDTTHFPFKEMPEFEGGEKAMFKYLAQEVRYPEKAINKGIQGVVKIIFIVDKNGQLQDIKIYKGVYPSLNYEAIRIIEKMDVWKPGKIDGEIAETKFIIPIKFVLQ
ncbi:MAG: TonB family protein [Chitinophagaceae bacterium]|nr:TonB family protein [Chitinophagaceae bacterium]